MPKLLPHGTLAVFKAECERENARLTRSIRMLLAASGMTHEELARMCGVSRPTLDAWIKDPGRIRLSNLQYLKRLMKKYEVPTE